MDINKSTLAALTIGGGSAVDVLKPDVTWLLNGCPGPRPDSVDELVTLLLIGAALLVWHVVKSRDPALVEEVEAAEEPQPQQ